MNRTLVCVIGQTRAHELSWKSFKRNILDELRADLLLCIHFSDEYDFSNPFWQFAKYHSAHPDLSDWGVGFDEAQEYEMADTKPSERPNWRVLLGLPGILLAGIKGSAWEGGASSILIYYRWLLAKYILSEGLLDKYDRFILTRSDFIWECPHPPMSILDPGSIWIPDGEQYRGVSDRHTVLSKENVIDYLHLIHPIILEPQSLLDEMRGVDYWNIEAFVKFYLTKRKLIQKVKRFPYIMYAARQWGGRSTLPNGVWSDDLGFYLKYPIEYRLAQSASKIIKSKADWSAVFSESHEKGVNCLVLDENQRMIGLSQGGNPSQLIAGPFVNVDGPVLSIDFMGDNGFLYIWHSNRDVCDKHLLDEIKVINVNAKQYHFQSVRDGKYYMFLSDGRLSKDTAKANPFFIMNRYKVE